MSDPLEISKIVCPVLPKNVLHRDSLVAQIEEAVVGTQYGSPTSASLKTASPHYKFVLVYAPAGYGKTTLLADFAMHTSITCCWYFLSRTDTDKITFLRNLILSIRYQFPDFGHALDGLLTGAITPKDHSSVPWNSIDVIADAFIAALREEISERLAILLCNYHEVNSCPELNELVNYLLRRLPSHCTLIIEGRAIPQLDLAVLLANRDMFGIGIDTLRFTTKDILDLAAVQKLRLSDKEAEQLVEIFEGWITGILLGTQLGGPQFLSRNIYTSFLTKPSGIQMDRQKLFTYIVGEVFKDNPEEYTFLKDISIFPEITSELCDIVLDITNASERLAYLEQNGFFVILRDSIYYCHSVLRELLYEDLRHQSPDRFTLLHQRAARFFHQARNYEQAMYYAQEVHAYDIATLLILDSYRDMLDQGHLETLARWIDALPEECKLHHPKLLLMRVSIYFTTGEYGHVTPLLKIAEELMTAQPPVIDSNDLPTFRAEVTIAKSRVLFYERKYLEAQSLCSKVLATLSVDERELCAQAHQVIGISANVLGDYSAGIMQLQKALQLWGRHTMGRQTATLHAMLTTPYSLLGNFALAEHHISRAIACRESFHDDWGKVYDLVRMGLIKWRQGALKEAEAVFNQGLALASGPIHFQLGQAYSLVNLGELYQDQELYDRSLIAVEEGLALARQENDQYLINCSLCVLSMTYLYTGDAATATLLVSETDLYTADKEQIGFERAKYELAFGAILLHQKSYDEAYAHLSAIESSLNTLGIKRELIQAKLRIASYYLIREQSPEALHRLQEMSTLLTNEDGYESLVQVELRRLPELQQMVKTSPELNQLRVLLHIEPEKKMGATGAQASVTTVPSALIQINQPTLKIQAFGEPTVLLEGKTITRWRMARAMELCFYLIDSNRPKRKEQIINALWDEVDDQINQTFHSTIYYLRKALGETCIVSQRGTYTLDLASTYGDNIWYDVKIFKELYIGAQQSLKEEEDKTAEDALQRMVGLYQGDYVQSFYSDWCNLRRDELRRNYLDARRQLAYIAWRDERFDESAFHWQHMLAVDNCSEDAHYGLMRCYSRQGKRGLALRQYQRCKDILQHELSVAPGATIQNFYQRLVSSS